MMPSPICTYEIQMLRDGWEPVAFILSLRKEHYSIMSPPHIIAEQDQPALPYCITSLPESVGWQHVF